MVRRKKDSEKTAAFRTALRVLRPVSEEEIERWLHEVVVPAYDKAQKDPSTVAQVKAKLAAHRRARSRATKKRPR